MQKKYENKILLVDDDTKNLQVAMNILKDYNVIYAQSGDKALELLEKNNFDLILLDVVMPTMDGYFVCSKIKQNEKTKKIPVIFLTVKDDEKTKNIPIIFLSGKDSSSDIEQAYESGGIDYVVKPFITIELITKANSYVRLKQLEDKFASL